MNEMNLGLTTAEVQTLLTHRISSLQGLRNMLIAYNKYTPEQLEKSEKSYGKFSMDSQGWRAAYSVTTQASVSEIASQVCILAEAYRRAVEADARQLEQDLKKWMVNIQ